MILVGDEEDGEDLKGSRLRHMRLTTDQKDEEDGWALASVFGFSGVEEIYVARRYEQNQRVTEFQIEI
ncbi:hypothetical protein SOVF_023330 [Spinacia oleracea]|nr:hypothetical protein SOVF_023330 [Spinacia oleracea]